jgi:putative transposase
LSRGKPEIFNTDQGSQFTSPASTGALLALGVQVSPDEYGTFGMGGKGRYLDNIFVERLWRSIKYEEVYLKAYKDGTEAKQGIGAYLDFYNRERPHQALGYWAPEKMFHDGQPRKRPEGQEEILIPGVETKPLAAEDSLNLAPLLFR